MGSAAVVLARLATPERRAVRRPGIAPDVAAARAAAAAGPDELIVVLADESRAAEFPEEATLLLDESRESSTRSLRSALDWCQREGHDVVVVTLGQGAVATDPSAWRALLSTGRGPITILAGTGSAPVLARLDVEAWPTVPLDAPLAQVVTACPELVVEIDRTPPILSDAPGSRVAIDGPSDDDVARVTRLLGRPPQGDFSVVVRGADGDPVVIENAPFLDDGTPMPTRYWLVGKREQEAVGRLESTGGVRQATAAVPAAEIASAHARYAAARDARIPGNVTGPRPYGGVGGTREGVKCLHAHLAWYLAGGSDPVGRWTALQLAGEIDGPVGAIDCGTNFTRILVLGRDGATLVREMEITRLGEGVDRTGELSPEAVERTLITLRRYREILDAHGVVAVRAAATSAARDAANSDLLFDGAERALGVRPELLTGEEEGRLSYAGATADLAPGSGPFLVCDLGGGSTELVAGGDGGVPVAAVSLALGCVRITERFLHSDPPTEPELDEARRHIADLIDEARHAEPGLDGPKEMIGLAGTTSALVALSLGLEVHDFDQLQHARLERSTIERYLVELSTLPLAERRRRRGLEPGRADVIVGGALALATVMDQFGFTALVYSESDILDGLAADLRRRRSAITSRR